MWIFHQLPPTEFGRFKYQTLIFDLRFLRKIFFFQVWISWASVLRFSFTSVLWRPLFGQIWGHDINCDETPGKEAEAGIYQGFGLPQHGWRCVAIFAPCPLFLDGAQFQSKVDIHLCPQDQAVTKHSVIFSLNRRRTEIIQSKSDQQRWCSSLSLKLSLECVYSCQKTITRTKTSSNSDTYGKKTTQNLWHLYIKIQNYMNALPVLFLLLAKFY